MRTPARGHERRGLGSGDGRPAAQAGDLTCQILIPWESTMRKCVSNEIISDNRGPGTRDFWEGCVCICFRGILDW
jgi:hypothetical protein